MKHRRRGKPSPPAKSSTARRAPAKSAEPHAAHHGSHIIADVLVGLAIALLLTTVNWGIEKTAFGEQFRESTYDVLQLQLMSKFDPANLEVTVVDITGIPTTRATSHDYDYTDRQQLKNLIRKIAAQGPRAIGVDVDFTPYPDQMSDDDEFLTYCAKLRKPDPASSRLAVPIYVATFQSLLLGPSFALYEPDYAPLAAYAGFPLAGEDETPKKMVDSVVVHYFDENHNTQDWTVPSLSAATAGIPIAPPAKWASWAIDRVSNVTKEGFNSTEFYVNYGPLDGIIARTIAWDDSRIGTDAHLLDGKIVLIGRGQQATSSGDRHILPGHRGKLFAGVYIHACAAYTLLHHPLQKLTFKGRTALDISLSLLVLIPVALVRWRYRAAEPHGGIAHHRLSAVLTVITAVVAFAAGVYAVNVHHLMWDDSLFVATALLIEGLVERRLVSTVQFIAHLLTLGWGLLLFKQDEGGNRPLDEETRGH